MRRWLLRLLQHSDRASEGRLDALEATVMELSGRVRDLEGERVALLAEWGKTRDQVLRHLQRVAQLQKLDEARTPADELSRQVLTLKMRGVTK